MPRHKKCRRIWRMPEYSRFGPEEGGEGTVIMTVEEYETLRLIDLEGKTQEQCAESMDVARTTVQAIYELARRKAAESIVNGKRLLIEGGDYIIADDWNRGGCGGGHGYHGGR